MLSSVLFYGFIWTLVGALLIRFAIPAKYWNYCQNRPITLILSLFICGPVAWWLLYRTLSQIKHMTRKQIEELILILEIRQEHPELNNLTDDEIVLYLEELEKEINKNGN